MRKGTKWIIGIIVLAGFTALMWPVYTDCRIKSSKGLLMLNIDTARKADLENPPKFTTDQPVVRIRSQDEAGTVLSVQTKGSPNMYIGVTKEGKVVAYDEDSNQLLEGSK